MKPTNNERALLASLSLSMLMPSLDTSIANAALPAMAQAFSAEFHAVQWIVLAYLLAITTLIIGVGRLGDIVGRRRLLLAGIALFTVASALCCLAPTLWFLITARAVQGVGAAVMMALAVASVPKEKTGRAIGLLGTMSAMGTSLGPSLGGLLLAGHGWRAMFLVNMPLGILNFLLTRRYLPIDQRKPEAARAAFDRTGMLLLGLTLAAYALAMTISIAFLPGAVIGAALFLRTEAKAKSPLIPLALLGNPTLSASLAMSTLVSTVLMSTLVVGPFYLTKALDLQAAQVGFVLSAGPLAAALTGVPAGRIVDRVGPRPTTIAGLIGIGAGCLVLTLLPPAFGTPGYILPIVCITASYSLFQTANNTAIMADSNPDRRGVISGLLNLSRNLGLITGGAVMGAVFAMASARADTAVAGGMRFTFAIAEILIVVALVIAIGNYRRTVRGRMREQPVTPYTSALILGR